MEWTLVIYEASNGERPFSEWMAQLKDARARARIRARLNRVRLGNFGDCTSVGSGVSELRIDYGPGYRVYFGTEGNRIVVLLCGGDKRRQSTDIERAKAYWKEHKHG